MAYVWYEDRASKRRRVYELREMPDGEAVRLVQKMNAGGGQVVYYFAPEPPTY